MTVHDGSEVPGRRLVALVATPILVAVTVVGATLGLLSATGQDSTAGAAPLELSSVPGQIAGHYHAAADLADAYRQVPCYCGCEEFLGHRHLYDCFVRSDGTGWEAHAARCGVCIAESTMVRDLSAAGGTPSGIADAVSERFGATPITTPPD